MPGSATFDPPSVPLTDQAATILVALYDRNAPSGSPYQLLRNVRCEWIEFRIGAQPPVAQLSYQTDSSDPSSPFPKYVEDLWPLSSSFPGAADTIAKLGSELVVLAVDAQGNVAVLFDGFADAPQCNLAAGGQIVTFTANGVAIRCWDAPLEGAIYRDADDPNDGEGVQTELPLRFNPDGAPNATPSGHNVDEGTNTSHPLFLDALLNRKPDPRRAWTLGMFVQYLLQTRDSFDLEYVDNPTSELNTLSQYFQALIPTSGDTGTINVADSSTYTAKDIVLDDVIASERAWPEALAATLDRHGFDVRFDLGQSVPEDQSELPTPTNELFVSRRDGLFSPAPKTLHLQKGPVALDPGLTNVGQLALVRDARHAANEFTMISRPTRYEISVVLAPGFHIDAADASNPGQFATAALVNATAEKRAKYRVFIADEAGDGHWDEGTGTWVTGQPLDLDGVFADSAVSGGFARWVVRNRPAIEQLLTVSDAGRPLRAELAIHTRTDEASAYGGPVPGLWDGSNLVWQSTGNVGWRLLKDRLGIEITADNPNHWKLAKTDPGGGAPAVPGEIVRIVESLAAPGVAGPQFELRLTCVIEGDFGVQATAPKRVSAPGPFTVAAKLYGRDVYQKNVVDASSIYGGGSTNSARDDTDRAKAQAVAMRAASENPTVAAKVVIPHLSLSYLVGDRISSVDGRGIDLRANAGTSAGESGSFPTVISLRLDFSGGKQETHLELAETRDWRGGTV